MDVSIRTIGTIHSPFTDLEGMPIQPAGAAEVIGEVEVDEEYAPGLDGLDGFSHIYLLYYFHKAPRTELTVTPYLDTRAHGVLATRSPLRPSHIGLSVVQLLEVEGRRLRVRGLDVLDGTPLLDIKPYMPAFDAHPDAATGWMQADAEEVSRKRSDDRFV